MPCPFPETEAKAPAPFPRFSKTPESLRRLRLQSFGGFQRVQLLSKRFEEYWLTSTGAEGDSLKPALTALPIFLRIALRTASAISGRLFA